LKTLLATISSRSAINRTTSNGLSLSTLVGAGDSGPERNLWADFIGVDFAGVIPEDREILKTAEPFVEFPA
jgi:hypothetical protein